MEERIQKILAKKNVASRRAAEQMIIDGRVKVNGKVALLGDKADGETDVISVDGVKLQADVPHEYILLYKPAGYITSVTDPRGRRTIMDLLPKGNRLYPVGRLDYATSGLLLVTNDGDLTNALLHPRGEVNKTYDCAVLGNVTKEQIAKLERGIMLSDGITSPAKARIKKVYEEKTIINITIHEGRNRQVRRMMNAVGLEVFWLARVGFANLDLEGLRPSEYRHLTEEELLKLREIAHV